MIIAGRATTTVNLEQYAWFGLFLLLCIIIAASDNDTQILSAICTVVAIFAPVAAPIILLLRIASHAYVVVGKPPQTQNAAIPFESLYPDKKEAEHSAVTNSYNICF